MPTATTLPTIDQYKQVIDQCKALFEKKQQDYGTSWRILRLPSITDQLMIKAKRIRKLQEQGTRKVDEGIEPEFVGIVNYAIIALMQLALHECPATQLDNADEKTLYDQQAGEIQALLAAKNHDYGEAWRDMRVSSMTDIILMRLLRIKQIEDNAGTTLVSEGVKANYQDIVNYAVFCLLQLGYGQPA